MHPAHVAEHLEIVVGRLVGESGVGMGAAAAVQVYGRHPIDEETVGVPEDASGEHDELVYQAVVGPVETDELVGVCGFGGLVESIYEIHAYPFDHMESTSFSRTLE